MSSTKRSLSPPTEQQRAILNQMGHPRCWAKGIREALWKDHHGGRGDELDIAAIRGFAGRTGYLGYLTREVQELTEPQRRMISLVTDEEQREIREHDLAEARDQLAFYTRHLHELEQDPGALLDFISHCRTYRAELNGKFTHHLLRFTRAKRPRTRTATAEELHGILKEMSILEEEICSYRKIFQEQFPH